MLKGKDVLPPARVSQGVFSFVGLCALALQFGEPFSQLGDLPSLLLDTALQ